MSSDKPENANDGCPGAASEAAGKDSACDGCPNQSACASGAGRQVDPAVEMVAERLSGVKHILLVLSGKGGVGKSTFSAQLAFTLAAHGRSVGLLDVDICGPSVPRMLGLVGAKVHQSASGWSPVWLDENLGVMSIGFMLPDTDDAIIWRGPRKNGLIRQFLTDVDWGTLDYLIVDTPPGTSDEHISMIQFLKGCGMGGGAVAAAAAAKDSDGAAAAAAPAADGAPARPVPTVAAVVVTTPQEIAMSDVRKELNFCKKTGLAVVGVVENMSGYLCPCCGHKAQIFPPAGDGPAGMAQRFQVPYLGALPIDPLLLQSCEAGEAYVVRHADAPGVPAFLSVVGAIAQRVEGPGAELRKPGDADHEEPVAGAGATA